jgi:regulator of sigma E protease
MSAGLMPGDRILSVDGEAIGHIFTAGKLIAQTPPVPHTLSVLRGERSLEISITPELVQDGSAEPRPMIGVRWAPEPRVLVHENPFRLISGVVYMTFDVLKALLNPRSDVSVKDMSGPVGIAHALFASARESLAMLLFLVVFININLAIVNLLPLPVLDGGHIAFAIAEKLRGKPLPPRLMANSQALFIILLFSMMAYITLHDIMREFDMARTRKEIRQVQQTPDPVFSPAADAAAPAQTVAPTNEAETNMPGAE